MADNRTYGAKQALQNMLFYYMFELSAEYENPKDVITKELGEMIDLSEEMAEYVRTNISLKNKLSENLEMCVKLLKKEEEAKVPDKESIKIVRRVLETISKIGEGLNDEG